MSVKKNILVICGPTASGKTSLALSVAKLLPLAYILSADSRQIYTGLDILTGKDIPDNLPPSIRIFGLDLVLPNRPFNVSDFVTYSQKIISESGEQNIPLIIVGGTGLYLKAITSNLLDVHVPPNQDLRSELEKLDLGELKKRLEEINPSKYSSLNNSDLNNPRRLIRAIEISSATVSRPGGTQTTKALVIPGLTRNPSNSSELSRSNFLWLGLKVDKKILEKNIHQRVENRLNNGAIDEVDKLIRDYPDTSLPIHTSLGVKQIKEFLADKISKEELVDVWTKAELDYAQRQMVWFKKQTDIIWYDKDKITLELVNKLATQIQ